MPDWLPSAVIASASIALMVWLVDRVVPGGWRVWLLGPQARTTLRRPVTGRRTLTTWIMVVIAVLALLLLLYYVFSQT
jgi:hypothetical protein